jgi:type IV secretory pathway VirB2 component (pilin)
LVSPHGLAKNPKKSKIKEMSLKSIMSSLQIAVSVALVLVIVKFIASLLGKGNIPLLNQAVTVILSLFIAFELFQLGQALYQSQL